MSTELTSRLQVGELAVDVVRKDIKNLHLAVYPPAGRVRVAVPLRVEDEAVRLAVLTRMGWIRRRQADFEQQIRLSQRDMVTGESHYFQGRRYRLKVVQNGGSPGVRVAGRSTLEVRVPPESSRDRREGVLNSWYRRELKQLILSLMEKWAPLLAVHPPEVRIRRMKTRWGSCNSDGSRIELNLELAKKPLACLEYVFVHELTHIKERKHNENFRTLLDDAMPTWRVLRDELNQAPLAHEDWTY